MDPSSRNFEELKSSLVSLVSHELRTPLTYVSGALEMLEIALKEPSMKQEVETFLGIIEQGVQQLHTIIDDLLLFSNLEKTPQKSIPTQIQEGVEIRNLLYDVVNTLKPSFQGKKQKVTLACEDVLPELTTDRGKLFEVLLQIMSNAIKFTPHEGNIHIRAENKSKQVAIIISDNGPGIPQEIQSQIFDPFFQEEEHLIREHRGLGLGLTLAQRLCYVLGAEIRVETNEDKGTSFIVEIPQVNPTHEKTKELEKLKTEVKNMAQSQEVQKKHIFELKKQLWKYAADLKVASQSADLKQRELDNVYVDMMKGFAAALEARDPYTHGRSSRVTYYANTMADALNLAESEREYLEKGCLLFDIGYIGIPDEILHKDNANPLTAEERELIKMHPLIGINMLGDIHTFEPVIPIILHHHENWDGSGYPDGLKGDEIPFLARIIHLLDAFDAMISDRAYRPRFNPKYALEEIHKNAGTQFDPDLVTLFIELCETGALKPVLISPQL